MLKKTTNWSVEDDVVKTAEQEGVSRDEAIHITVNKIAASFADKLVKSGVVDPQAPNQGTIVVNYVEHVDTIFVCFRGKLFETNINMRNVNLGRDPFEFRKTDDELKIGLVTYKIFEIPRLMKKEKVYKQ